MLWYGNNYLLQGVVWRPQPSAILRCLRFREMDISLRYQSHWFVTREWSSVVLAERIRSQEEMSSCLWYRCLGVSIGIRSFSISTRIIFYALRVSVWYQAVCDCYLQPRQHEADQCDGVYKMHLDMEGQNVDNCDDWQNRKTWPLASCQDPW